MTVQSAYSGVPRKPCSGPLEPHGVEHGVDDAVLRLQQLEPHDAGDDLGQHVRHEDDRAQDALPPHLAVEQQRDGQTERELDGDRRHHDDQVVLERAGEDVVVEHAHIVLQADEVDQRAVALPAVGRELDGPDDRHHHEEQEQQEGGCHEEGDLQALAESRSRPTASARGRGHRPRRSATGDRGLGEDVAGEAVTPTRAVVSSATSVTSPRQPPPAWRRRCPAGWPGRRRPGRSRRSWRHRRRHRTPCRSRAGRTAPRHGS